MRAYKFLSQKHGLKSLRKKRLKISEINDLNDPFELIPYDLSDRHFRKALLRTRDQIAANRGMLCFCATWHDPVVWAHYSNRHSGLCLGFQIPNQKCRMVEYVEKRLPPPERLTLAISEKTLFTKYINWKYEQEIRMWAALNEKEEGIYFSDFGSELKLLKVIAGAKCSLSQRQIIRALGPLAENVTVIKARAAFKEFQIVEDRRGFPGA
jgi:hypothetical protein